MEAGERSAVVAARFGSDSVLCVSMVLECSTFLQRSKVLFPAHGPVFSSPVWAPHNWGLCSLWSSVLCSIHAVQVQCCSRVWDDMNSLVLLPQPYWRPGLIHCLSCVGAFLKVWLKVMTFLDMTPSPRCRVGVRVFLSVVALCVTRL